MTGKREIAYTASAFLRSLRITMDDGQPAARVGVPETLLDTWLRGGGAMPEGKLFLLGAILEELARTTNDSVRGRNGSLY